MILGASHPDFAVHSMVSIWSNCDVRRVHRYLDRERRGGERGEGRDIPVNVRPKTSSLAGRNSFGEVVFVMVNFEGSMSGSCVTGAVSTLLLAALVYLVAGAISLEGVFSSAAPRGRN